MLFAMPVSPCTTSSHRSTYVHQQTLTVIPGDLFQDGKPKVIGVNAHTKMQSDVTIKAIGGHPSVARFMSSISFPVVLKSIDLQDMRRDITANLGASTFEEAFHMICSVGGKSSYSQFEIMMNYLWYHKREEYSWHIADPESAAFNEINVHGSR